MALLAGLIARIVFGLIFYGTPLIAFWVVSSLAALLGGPHWIAWAAGALLFPVIPTLWELHAYSRRRPNSKAWFTPLDRVSMRTFVVGLAFLAGLLYFYPQLGFVALSTRGDWMLADIKDPRVPIARRYLFASANCLEWLYHATRSNPFKKHVDAKEQQRTELAAKQAEQDLAKQRAQQEKQQAEISQKRTEQKQAEETAQDQKQQQETVQKDEQQTDQDQQKQTAQDKPEETDQKQESAQKQDTDQHQKETATSTSVVVKWPVKTAIDSVVAAMPSSEETSIESVAQYIAKHETDPVQRIKALHDWVADRIAYDADAFYSGNYGDQDAQTVFKNRKGVCSGYANLLSALATAINEEIVVVYGDARDPSGDKLTGAGHAWNAARIGGHWYLIDATWDAGGISRQKGFTKNYRTDYLLTPPEVMIQDHFPEETTWQLLAQPMSQGDFLRQPMLRPAFQAAELTLVTPQRAQNESETKAFATIKNPKHEWLMANLEQDGKAIGSATMPTNTKLAQLAYPLPGKGRYRLNMWAHESRDGNYGFVGAVDFVNR